MAEPERGLAVFDAEFSRQQVELMKRICAKGATDDEFKVFLHFCRESGLDPLRKQAYFIERKWKDKDGNPRRETMMMAGIDGLRARAEKMSDFEGLSSAAVYTGDEISVDFGEGVIVHKAKFPRKKPILGAWAKLCRKGRIPAVTFVDMDEYKDDRSPMWRDKGGVMICKTAEATILRHEYPEPLSGIYGPEEVGATTGEHGEVVTTENEIVETEAGDRVDTATGEVVEDAPTTPEPAQEVAIGPERASKLAKAILASGGCNHENHLLNAIQKYCNGKVALETLTQEEGIALLAHFKEKTQESQDAPTTPEPAPEPPNLPNPHPETEVSPTDALFGPSDPNSRERYNHLVSAAKAQGIPMEAGAKDVSLRKLIQECWPDQVEKGLDIWRISTEVYDKVDARMTEIVNARKK